MKRFYIICLEVFILIGNCFAGIYSGGTGDPNTPYLIGTADDIIEMSDTSDDWDDHFLMIADVNMINYVFTTAVIAPDTSSGDGFQGIPFTGVFDGNGHKILNLTINTAGVGNDCLGLFGQISREQSQVKNLGLENVSAIGGISSQWLAGLCGRNGDWYRSDPGGTISNCYSIGSISGGVTIGGLCGQNDATISNCYATGSVSGSWEVGGLCGRNDGTISECYATGWVTGNNWSEDLGGLCGKNFGTISNCYATGSVTGVGSLGGLCGWNSGGTISNCYADSSVTGDYDTGGLCGWNDGGIINNCYATGSVTGDGSLGGLCGRNENGMISNCYAASSVTGDYNSGGLCGYNYGTISNCFWDIETSGLDWSAGGTGLPTAQMQTSSTFINVGWDFVGETDNGTNELWQIPPGSYPLLSSLSGYVPLELAGDGTSENPYLISDANELGAIYHYQSNAHYQLTTDIDFTGIIWSFAPIPSFDGTFDGEGYTITNLIINGGGYLGLFGRINSGQVRDLGLKDISIIGGVDSRYLGGLCGENSRGTISDCYSEGSVTGGDDSWLVGGLCGRNKGTINNCYATGSVSGDSGVGGLCGQNDGTISNSHATGSVTGGGSSIGGLCGRNGDYSNPGGTINNCYSIASVTGRRFVGGLCGQNENGMISNCYATGRVTGGNWSEYLGGLCGKNFGTISNCYSAGVVTGGNYSSKLGGLCGENWLGSMISNCYSTGSVKGFISIEVGGLCGRTDGTISNSYATGSVTGGSLWIGGLCGWNYGTISNCFWDIETSGLNTSDGGTGLHTSHMRSLTTFINNDWDFVDVWFMRDGIEYPRLIALNRPPIANSGQVQRVIAWNDGTAEVKLDGTDSYDPDGDLLEFSWLNDANELITAGAEPNVILPVGEHIITLIVNDGLFDSEPNDVVITVIESLKVPMNLTPSTLNCRSQGNWVKAHFTLSEQYSVADIDTNQPAVVHSSDIETALLEVSVNKDKCVEITASFNREQICSLSGDWPEVFRVYGFFTDGSIFYGESSIRLNPAGLKEVSELAMYWLSDCDYPDWCDGLDLNRDTMVNLQDYPLLMNSEVEFTEELNSGRK